LDRDGEFEPLCELYRPLFDRIIPVDEALVLRAIALKRAAVSRLPSIDALIAAAASLHAATLVHRDPHFQAIPADWLKQEVLTGV
jgi:predicted nucleic acid-binding protein